MIHISKPNAPAILMTHGSLAAEELKKARPGTRRFEFDSSIYAHREVKDALRKAQHDKCAFCESKLTHIGYGDIEHFRPKAAVRQNEKGELEYPGYYWLAYEWSNLFLSCQLCNEKFKRNCFPLRNPKSRVRSHREDLNRELPLLADPAGSPESHITFNGGMIVAKDIIGKTTIKVLGLDRKELVERRLTLRKFLLTFKKLRSRLRKLRSPTTDDLKSIREIETHLAEAITDPAEYAAMARVTLG
jgi:uncharacterized protein (TIGR02646 family)